MTESYITKFVIFSFHYESTIPDFNYFMVNIHKVMDTDNNCVFVSERYIYYCNCGIYSILIKFKRSNLTLIRCFENTLSLIAIYGGQLQRCKLTHMNLMSKKI